MCESMAFKGPTFIPAALGAPQRSTGEEIPGSSQGKGWLFWEGITWTPPISTSGFFFRAESADAERNGGFQKVVGRSIDIPRLMLSSRRCPRHLPLSRVMFSLLKFWRPRLGLASVFFSGRRIEQIPGAKLLEILQFLFPFFRNLAGGNPRIQLFADRKSTRLNSSHVKISYAVFC